jgi:hypothetical protein
MKTRLFFAFSFAFLIGSLALADASYQETTQITGGTLVSSLKSSPFAPKQIKKMFDPINSLTMVHGNQMAVVSATSAEIIDLDQETITRVDNEKKTYTVTTFADMRKAFKDAPQKLEQAQAQAKQAQQQRQAAPSSPASQLQVTFDVSVVDTGTSKVVNGQMSKEQVFTLKAHVTDPNAPPSQGGNTVTYNYVTDIWTTPDPPEVNAVRDFYSRYGKKLMEGVDTAALMAAMKPALNSGGLSMLFAGQPGMGPAMQEMTKKMATEMAKVKGTRVLEITQLGGDTGLTTAPGTKPGTTTAAGGGLVDQGVTQAAGDTVASQAGGKFGEIGGALTKSAIGLFTRNKPAAAPPTAAAAAGPAGAPASSVMYETTTQKSQFSQEAVPPEAFQVPNGYKKVEAPTFDQQGK